MVLPCYSHSIPIHCSTTIIFPVHARSIPIVFLENSQINPMLSHAVFPSYSISVPRMFPRRFPHTHIVFPWHSDTTPIVFSNYPNDIPALAVPIVFVFAEYSNHISRVSPECSQSIAIMFPYNFEAFPCTATKEFPKNLARNYQPS